MLSGAQLIPFPSCQVLVPTRVGQAYVYDSPKGEQDEYDFPRHLLSVGSQEIYDVPPVRGGVPSQFSQEVRLVGVRGVALALSPSAGDALAQPGIQTWANYTQIWARYGLGGFFWCLHPSQLVPGRRWVTALTPSCVVPPPSRSMTRPPWQ